ncbi:MAG TPA: hypothetical protein EYH34_05595 [Planctomycetes bacterium]|nr:hypothetical protein [Planctomycetota bacterium]
MNANECWLVRLEFQRVQTYLFAVSKLKAMVGANTLLGEVLRGRLIEESRKWGFAGHARNRTTELAEPSADDHVRDADNLPALAVQCGANLPQGVEAAQLNPAADLGCLSDPLSGRDVDRPVGNYSCGVLARDGGHMNAVFPDKDAAARFLRGAQKLVAEKLPGLVIDCRAYRLEKHADRWVLPKDEHGRPQQVELPDMQQGEANGEFPFHLPQFQVCDATGLMPAAHKGRTPDNEREWVSQDVQSKRESADRFANGNSFDILGVLRDPILNQLGISSEDEKRAAFATKFEQIAPNGYLAVIAADGNAIGDTTTQIEEQADKDKLGFFDREARVERFHHGNRVLVRHALLDAIEKTFGDSARKRPLPFRVLMLGGDDLLLVCDAAFAMPFVIEYNKAIRRWDEELRKHEAKRPPFTFGAGIAIVKRTFPFHRAHDLAEQLLSSAKRMYRERFAPREKGEKREGNAPAAVSTVDWLAITEAWHDELKDVRKRDSIVQYRVDGTVETLVLSGKPYPISGGSTNGHASSLDRLWAVATERHGVARTQLNALARMLQRGRRQAQWAALAATDDGLRKLLGKLHGNESPWLDPKEPTVVTRFLDFLELNELAREWEKAKGRRAAR